MYGTATIDTALSTPPPDGFTLEDKVVLFVTQQPDTDELMVKAIPQKTVLEAEIKQPKTKKSKDNGQDSEI